MNKNKLKVVLHILMLFFIVSSCCSIKSKSPITDDTIYKWGKKIVSKKRSDRLLKRYTEKFIKNSTKEELELFQNLEIVYDTVPKIRKN